MKHGKEFSKWLLIQESLLVWITTISFIVLAFLSLENQFFGEFTWLAALCTSLWAAYGVSQAFYYRKAQAENTEGGIKYDSVCGAGGPSLEEEEETLG